MKNAVYFLSDLHLGAAYDASSRMREKRVVQFLDSVQHDAKEIYLLGDIIDYWYEYKYVVPRGYVRFFGKLAELADQGVRITWLTGNHDIWLFDYFPSEIGVTVVDADLEVEIDGVRFFLAHGDRTGCDSRSFRLLQRLFRNKICQKLYAAIHPRWTVPFALRWSSSSRHKEQPCGDSCVAEELVDDNAMRKLHNFCLGYLASHNYIRYFVFGHLHTVARTQVGNLSEMCVIGDWLKHNSFARFADGKMSIGTFLSDSTKRVEFV